MSDIFEPEFDESPIEIDYTAPEPGKFPPQVEPGVYKLIFKLADKDAFTQKVIPTAGGTKQLVVLYAPEVILETGESKRIAFQNANSYKHPMVPNSSLADLLRSLDIRLDRASVVAVKDALLAASGQRMFRAQIGWKAYFADSGTTISTSPRKKQGELRWAKSDDGKYLPIVQDPVSLQKAYGRENIVRLLLPESESESE